MKFGWSREDVETLFYKGRIYVDKVFEMSMDRVFGTSYKGARWLPPELQEEKKEKWKRRGYQRTTPWWKVPESSSLHPSQMPNKDHNNAKWENSKWNYDQSNQSNNNNNNKMNNANNINKNNKNNNKDNKDNNFESEKGNIHLQDNNRRSLLNKQLAPNKKEIWDVISGHGDNKNVSAEQFVNNLAENGITMNPEIGAKLFNAFGLNDGNKNNNGMNEKKIGRNIKTFR